MFISIFQQKKKKEKGIHQRIKERIFIEYLAVPCSQSFTHYIIDGNFIWNILPNLNKQNRPQRATVMGQS